MGATGSAAAGTPEKTAIGRRWGSRGWGTDPGWSRQRARQLLAQDSTQHLGHTMADCAGKAHRGNRLWRKEWKLWCLAWSEHNIVWVGLDGVDRNELFSQPYTRATVLQCGRVISSWGTGYRNISFSASPSRSLWHQPKGSGLPLFFSPFLSFCSELSCRRLIPPQPLHSSQKAGDSSLHLPSCALFQFPCPYLQVVIASQESVETSIWEGPSPFVPFCLYISAAQTATSHKCINPKSLLPQKKCTFIY